MIIKSDKVQHGWRTVISEPEMKRRWQGNICPTRKASIVSAKQGLIENKKTELANHERWIKDIKSEIRKIRKL